MVFMVWKMSGGSSSNTRHPKIAPGMSFRIHPGASVQTEPHAAVHPSNPDILFVTANTVNPSSGFQSEGIYVSTNRGESWFGNDTCTGVLITAHTGNPGIAIDKNGRFILTRLGTSPGLYSHYSTNNGNTWSGFKTITTDDLYKAAVVSNGNPASEYYGRTYAVWTSYASTVHPVNVSYTDDGGVNWSNLQVVNNPASGKIGRGGEAVFMSNGDIAVCWARANNLSPFTEDFVGFASSANGGTTWAVTENAFDMNGIAGRITEKENLKTNGWPRIAVDRSGGERNDWLYIVSAQKNLSPAGNDPDIVLNRSIDSGRTWSSGTRVNQDLLNNGKYQYFPAIHVDAGGGLNVLYYDDRNTTSDSISVFLSRSTDGGVTWIDVQLSDHNFKPKQIPGLAAGYQGDNISLTSIGNTLWAFWMDNSSGVYQIWTKSIDINVLDVVDEKDIPTGFSLCQNYPNPFNPLTRIRFYLAESDVVTLTVHDLLGKEMMMLVNERLPAGEHSVSWDASNLPSGIYICRLMSGDQIESKKMLLLR